MEGRQAAIIAARIQDNAAESQALLAATTPTQPWEQQVAACLHLACSEPDHTALAHHLMTAIPRLAVPSPAANYASYRARLGLTLAVLARQTRPELATRLLSHVAQQAINSADGYAARDVLGFRKPLTGITEHQQVSLRRITTESGLGLGGLPDAVAHSITTTADAALKVLDIALHSAVQ